MVAAATSLESVVLEVEGLSFLASSIVGSMSLFTVVTPNLDLLKGCDAVLNPAKDRRLSFLVVSASSRLLLLEELNHEEKFRLAMVAVE